MKHGFTRNGKRPRLYTTWRNMRDRCNNPNSKDYYNYGLRGIKMCSEWDSFIIFYNWAIQNGYNNNLTIDRIDNDKGYCPENCRFITKTENNKNKRKRDDWGIYHARNGYSVVMTYNNLYYYGGYTNNIEEAREIRDKLMLELR